MLASLATLTAFWTVWRHKHIENEFHYGSIYTNMPHEITWDAWGPFFKSPEKMFLFKIKIEVSLFLQLPVHKTKWTCLLANNRLLYFWILTWIFDFGPDKLPRLSKNGPLVLAHWRISNPFLSQQFMRTCNWVLTFQFYEILWCVLLKRNLLNRSFTEDKESTLFFVCVCLYKETYRWNARGN